jgi:FtsP/CotA-like multicopper oxidase with cupredoxin domain
VGGGLVGAIIVEDEEGDIPPAFVGMPEMVLLMADTPVTNLIEKYICETGDDLFTSPDNVYTQDDEFVLVNGQYQPTGSVNQGEWTRLRLIFSGLSVALELQMTTNTAECEWFLLAKDGIYVEGAPRKLGDTVFLGPGNRADVVMRCSAVGEVVLGSTNTASDQAQQTNIVTLTVEASTASPDQDLPQFTPYHPDYLADLYTSTNTSTFDLSFAFGGGGCTINGESWDGSTSLGSMEMGSIQEWTVSGINKHPYHLHVNSYQLKDVTDDSGYFKDGDWHDCLYPPSGVSVDKTLFAVDSYVTKSIIHCHFLPHEDKGCMGYMQHTGDHGATTGLTGHAMWCLGTSTGSAEYYNNCTLVE